MLGSALLTHGRNSWDNSSNRKMPMRIDGIIKSHDAVFFMRVDCLDGLVNRPSVIGDPTDNRTRRASEIERQVVAGGHPLRKVAVRPEYRER